MSEALRNAVQRCVERGLTFAAFRIPGRVPCLWVQRTAQLGALDGAGLHRAERVFLLGPFLLDVAQVPFIQADIELSFEGPATDLTVLDRCSGIPVAHCTPVPATAPEAYAAWINAAQAAFASGALRKVVLSRTLELHCPRDRAADLFVDAMERMPQAFVALAHTPEHGLWCGASPERLVQADAGQVRVDALAGTMPASVAPAVASGWGEKERDEQELVTARILHTFHALELSAVRTTGPQVRTAGPVAHLHTALEAALGQRPLGELVLALHPTPAICGTPTDAALAFIRTYETHDRGLYAGFWGPWNVRGRTDLFVNIRCLRWNGDHAQLFVGAGITAGSDAAREWAETTEKAKVWSTPISALQA